MSAMPESILYYFDLQGELDERDRIHNRPECLIAARLGGVNIVHWSPSRTDPPHSKAKLKPCIGCGEPMA